MSEKRTILVLGASYAGLGVAHYILKHIIPKLLKESGVAYKLILVAPSTKFQQRHASPRAIISDDLIPFDKFMLDIEPEFKQYGDAFQFIHGAATAWDPTARTVTIQRVGQPSAPETASYYALILATGSKTYSPLFSNWGTDYTDTTSAVEAFRQQLKTAKSIVITGGGPTSVETAGGIGEYLNGAAGWFSSRPAHPKAKITLVTKSDKLLPMLRKSIAAQAEVYLNRVGVDVRYGTEVASSRSSANGKTIVVFHNGEELETDIYIPAVGVTPLSAYIPDGLKNEQGYLKQNNETLRVDAAGPRVYAIGDVGTASRNTIVDVKDETPVLASNLQKDLMSAPGADRKFQPGPSEMQVVPVGRSKGVGAAFGWRIPSFAVWLIKGRDYMLWAGEQTVTGSKFNKEDQWQGA